ncbi:MAG: hydrogenase nickel incorporation protein HypB [Planctomycetaceae bacterium]|nr:hydrogenase nickel incorporation protein HypB [Planctomycetaceae bacterium]
MASVTISVQQDVLAERRQKAAELRDEFSRKGTLVVNVVSSPGAGKTSLLQAMARHWNGAFRIAVLVGDIATERDAERLRPHMPAEQLTTGGACHLEIPLVRKGLERLGDRPLDFLFIENIGNLVCPASWDLGEHLRVVLLSTTEGDDKPGKYPKMFRTSHVLVITKSDLLPYVPFNVASAIEDAHQIQPQLSTFVTSALHDEGVDAWCSYLVEERGRMLKSTLLSTHDENDSP